MAHTQQPALAQHLFVCSRPTCRFSTNHPSEAIQHFHQLGHAYRKQSPKHLAQSLRRLSENPPESPPAQSLEDNLGTLIRLLEHVQAVGLELAEVLDTDSRTRSTRFTGDVLVGVFHSLVFSADLRSLEAELAAVAAGGEAHHA